MPNIVEILEFSFYVSYDYLARKHKEDDKILLVMQPTVVQEEINAIESVVEINR